MVMDVVGHIDAMQDAALTIHKLNATLWVPNVGDRCCPAWAGNTGCCLCMLLLSQYSQTPLSSIPDVNPDPFLAISSKRLHGYQTFGPRLFISIPVSLPHDQHSILKLIFEVSQSNLLYPVLRYVVAQHSVCPCDHTLWIKALGEMFGPSYRLSLSPGPRAQREVLIQSNLTGNAPWHCPYTCLAAMAFPYLRFRLLTAH